MNWNLLGKILATALLGLEDATQAYSNQATIPNDINSFTAGIISIWATHPAAVVGTSKTATASVTLKTVA